MKNPPRSVVSAKPIKFTSAGNQAMLAAALALLLLVPPARSEPLGRLFITPERRAVLERQRQLNIQEKTQETVEVDKVHLNGVVHRSGGKATIWVNGRPQRDDDRNTGIALRPSPKDPGRVAISVGDENPTTLRIGETLNRGTQEKTDGLAGGQLQVNRDHAEIPPRR